MTLRTSHGLPHCTASPQGDFITELLAQLEPELSRPANKQNTPTLLGLLEGALRAARRSEFDDEDRLKRLSIRVRSRWWWGLSGRG